MDSYGHPHLSRTAAAAGEVTSGSGLGLTICQKILLALGGSLRLDNGQQGRSVGLEAHARLPLQTAGQG
jgi:two-component system sensor histidine kinase TctE